MFRLGCPVLGKPLSPGLWMQYHSPFKTLAQGDNKRTMAKGYWHPCFANHGQCDSAQSLTYAPLVPNSWRQLLQGVDESYEVALTAQAAKSQVVGVVSRAICTLLARRLGVAAGHASSRCGGLSPTVFPIVPGESVEACRPSSGGALSPKDALPPASSSSQAWHKLQSFEHSATTSSVERRKSRSRL